MVILVFKYYGDSVYILHILYLSFSMNVKMGVSCGYIISTENPYSSSSPFLDIVIDNVIEIHIETKHFYNPKTTTTQ